MSSSTVDHQTAAANVDVSDETLTVELADGRVLSVPISWFPRLVPGTKAERKHWLLIGASRGIHWPALDEDIRVEGLLAGITFGQKPEIVQEVAGDAIMKSGKPRTKVTEKEWAKQLRDEIASCISAKDVRVHVAKSVPYKLEIVKCGDDPICKRFGYATDVLIREELSNGQWKPRVIIEVKINSINTHS